jgi:hypothetical protein
MPTSIDNFYLGDVASNFHFAGTLLDFEEEIKNESPFHDLEHLTNEIKRGFLDYVRQGIMLDAIQRLRLYKDKFKDFKTYCEKALSRQHFYCQQIIKAAGICLRLIKAGFEILPSCVAQVVPLFKHATINKYGDSPLEQKWQKVVDEVPKARITAITISETIDDNPDLRPKQIRIKNDTYALLTKKAAAAGMSISELLARLVDEYNPRDLEKPENPAEHTPEQEKILDELDEEFKKPVTEQRASSATGNKSQGFGVKVKSKTPSRKLKSKSSENEIKLKRKSTEIKADKQSHLSEDDSHNTIAENPDITLTQVPGTPLTPDSVPPN